MRVWSLSLRFTGAQVYFKFPGNSLGNFLSTILQDIGVCTRPGTFLCKLQLLGGVRDSVPTPREGRVKSLHERTLFKAEGWK